MVSRRGWRASALCLLALGVLAVPVSLSAAAPPPSAVNENANTLVVSLPGPFTGCTYLDAGATSASDAILDLIRPSAFLTNPNGTLAGEDGPIASAELTSLQPETVRYTIGAHETWSNGAPFKGSDLVAWWQEAKTLASVTSDGYRAIGSLTVAKNKLSVTAVFAKPYADWELLFRDVEAPGTPLGCAIANLLSRPSLGPYEVTSATPSRVVLAMNPNWPLDANRFGRIVLIDGPKLPTNPGAVYAAYTLGVNSASILALSNHPTLLSRIASSNDVEELTFAPSTNVTDVLGVRQALSWSIQRQLLIDKVFGSVTYSPSVAASAIYSQGQSQYPGPSGSNPVGQATTTTTVPITNGLGDCVTCAVTELKHLGYQRSSSGWVSPSGRVLSVRLAVGPSALDHSVATLVRGDWSAIGIASTVLNARTETTAAEASATGKVDVALFARPTTTTPSYAARSWAGPAYPNTYPSGVRLAPVTALYNEAESTFNPVTATSTWLHLDQAIMTGFWVRPLFTAPSLAVWSSSLITVQGSFTLPGFVDQFPTWSVTPAATGS